MIAPMARAPAGKNWPAVGDLSAVSAAPAVTWTSDCHYYSLHVGRELGKELLALGHRRRVVVVAQLAQH